MNHSNQDESRRQFETYFSQWYPDMTKANGGLNYADPTLDMCWIAWKASRAAIEIECPPRIEEIHLRQPREVEDMWLHRFKFAAESSGLKVKGIP